MTLIQITEGSYLTRLLGPEKKSHEPKIALAKFLSYERSMAHKIALAKFLPNDLESFENPR